MPRNIKVPAAKKSLNKRKQKQPKNVVGPLSEPKLDYSFTLKRITPMTQAQQDAFDAFDEGYHLVLTGCAGTGKTFISLYLALRDIITRKKDAPSKVMIIRSTVPTRDIGFLPGTADEKISVYTDAYKAIVNELFGRGDAWQILVNKKIIEFCSTSFLRGSTINDTFIIADEYSNCNLHELETILTRSGKNTRLIYSGDTAQSDLVYDRERKGHQTFVNILDKMESFDIIEFGVEDIVRSGIVKEYLQTKHKLGI
jgi:phosphate starvation-inducible PhoH-like protein